jgi:hypothetical protein
MIPRDFSSVSGRKKGWNLEGFTRKNFSDTEFRFVATFCHPLSVTRAINSVAPDIHWFIAHAVRFQDFWCKHILKHIGACTRLSPG